MHLCSKSKIPMVAQIRMPRLNLLQPNVKNINGTHTSSVNYIAVLSVHEDGVPHVVCAFVMLSTHHEANLQRWGLVDILSKCFTLNYFPSLHSTHAATVPSATVCLCATLSRDTANEINRKLIASSSCLKPHLRCPLPAPVFSS